MPHEHVSGISSGSLAITYVSVQDLIYADYNPRRHTDTDEQHLTDSITKYGTVEPLIVNSAPERFNIIIGGHFRLEILKKLDYKEMPVVYVSIPDLERERELNLRLNRNTGEWDFEKLKAFDIGLLLDIGFDDVDLSHIWDDALETHEDGFDISKELAAQTTPLVQPGQLWQLGNHRLLCGSATNADDVQRLMGNARVDMVYLDPPYNIDLDYHRGIGSTMRYGGKTNDKKTAKEYRVFLQQALTNTLQAANADCHVFTYCDQSNIGLLQELYGTLDLNQQRVCLWIKNNMNVTLQVAFSKCYEPCVYGIRGKPYLSPRIKNQAEILNKEIGTGNRAIDDIFDTFDIWLAKRVPNMDYEHPTEKPPTLHEKPLRRCTKPGDRVLDLFGGSGSTLIACEQMKRQCHLIEIEPVFCDLILRRFEALTGLTPSLIQS